MLPYTFAKTSNVRTQAEQAQYDDIMSKIERSELTFNERLYKRKCAQIAQKNAELHSMRCDLKLKLWVAEKFLKEEKIYFPHNLDFRGRAYPIPQNLNHIGSDLCRGMLLFSDAKPLGPYGLTWLKIQLCNLFGNNKVSRQDRARWTEDHMPEVIDSAVNPLTGSKFWAQAENPFQALACCMEIHQALQCPEGPEHYRSHLPVHQDGSCNGLQHYAALGRDYKGGAAVNLITNTVDKPADVYSEVLAIVKRRIAEDVLISPEEPDDAKRNMGVMARLVQPVVNRKVIKQTVMTSVYGVTRIGARLQVEKQIE